MHSDFQQLFSMKYVSVRIGKLPVDNLPKLDYYDENFFFVPFETGKSFCWGMYFVPERDKQRVDDIFHSMYFERIRIPSYVSGDAFSITVRPLARTAASMAFMVAPTETTSK